MSQDNKRKIQYCVYCGEDVGESKTYCPKCGKLIVKLKSDENQEKSRIIHRPVSIKREEISRKCSGCGSIITSTILDQCPICNAPLEKISEAKKAAIQKKPALIFTDKKLEPEQKFIINTINIPNWTYNHRVCADPWPSIFTTKYRETSGLLKQPKM